MEVNDIVKLIEAVSKNKLSSLEYDNGKEVLVLRKEKEREVQQVMMTSTPTVLQSEGPVSAPLSSISKESNIGIGFDQVVTSPLVGTFYSAASPDAQPFVKVGDQVKKGQILGIIEAMKLMNEIESEYDGVVEAILINNEDLVEYGQPLFRIR